MGETPEDEKTPVAAPSTVQLPKWVARLIIAAIPALFIALQTFNEMRHSEDKDDVKEANAKATSADSTYKELLIKWNENSIKLGASYNVLLQIQKDEYYRKTDSLLQILYILRQNQERSLKNQEHGLRNQTQILKKVE